MISAIFTMTIFDELEPYYAQHLSARELRQFHKAEGAGPCGLLTRIIQPNAYRPERRSYMGVEQRMDVYGRSHLTARDLAAGKAEWECQSLFTNTLRIACQGDLDFTHPKDRTVLGPYYIHTFEFDSKDMAFFKQQLSWFRSAKHPLDAPIGKFVAELRDRYADFVGLNVTYSGNKSFHFHFVFSTALIAARVPAPTSLRDGLVKAWERLGRDFVGCIRLAVPETEAPDPALRFPECNRRLPGGYRLIGSSHMFDLPEQSVVPQLVMFEHLTLNRKGSGTSSIFEATDFLTPTATPLSGRSVRVPNGQRTVAVPPFDESSDEEKHCAGEMLSIFSGDSIWPRFEGFRHEQGRLRAYFSNCPDDRNPASYMDESFSTVFIQGSNPLGLSYKPDAQGRLMPRLPRPLGAMVEVWTTGYRARLLAPGGRERTALEQEFADKAIDRATAATAVGEILDRLVTQDIRTREGHLLCGPEGISKTRSLIRNIPLLHELLRQHGLPGLMMFAFQSYETAEEKAEEFDAFYAQVPEGFGGFKAVILPSFSRLYEETCDKLGVSKLSLIEATQAGFVTLLSAIQTIQPEVMDEFQSFFADRRRSIGRLTPVIFTVHAVAHDWSKGNDTRLLFSVWWWSRFPEIERRLKAREDTELGLLIHDEVSAENLLTVVPLETIHWVRRLAAMRDPSDGRRKLWPSTAPLAESQKVFASYAASNPPPHPLTFERAREIRSVKNADWDVVTTTALSEYGERTTAPGQEDIYAATAGRSWGIQIRTWPTTSAHRTLILTTEAVPTVIARKLGSALTVTELDTPAIPRDVVQVKASREVISANLAVMVSEAKAAHLLECGRPLAGIGNKMGNVPETKTHVGAKGSNAFIGKDIIQTMVAMPPEQYAFYDALNAWTGRDDLVRLRHLDEFNQTAGRNLGFRAPQTGPTPVHKLLINRRLFESLVPMMGHARYEMRETISQHAQKVARAQARSPEAFLAPPRTDSKDRMAAIRTALFQMAEPPESAGL